MTNILQYWTLAKVIIVMEVPQECHARYKPKSGHNFWFIIMHYNVSFSLRLIILFNFKFIENSLRFQKSGLNLTITKLSMSAMFIYLCYLASQVTRSVTYRYYCMMQLWNTVHKVKYCKHNCVLVFFRDGSTDCGKNKKENAQVYNKQDLSPDRIARLNSHLSIK